jgi:hypothetical protein
MAKSNQNIQQLNDFLNYQIENNRYLQSKGKIPKAIEVIGESGIGKTSAIIQLAEEHKLNFVKLNLTQIEELGDLIGYPKEEYQIFKTVTEEDKAHLNFTKIQVGKKIQKWVDKVALIDYKKKGFVVSGKTRMGYSTPEWIANKKDGGILLLDDWNRADMRFIQAIMEIIDRQEYISWKLPKDWHIILTANPDNGEYMVNSIDNAQRTRFISVNLQFNVDVWAKWAEEAEVDTRCINFLLMHPELVTVDINARSITNFFDSISSIKDFKSRLGLVQMCGEGSVGEEFSSLFSMFINNNLDKLVTPKYLLLEQDEKLAFKKLQDCIGTGDDYRADIASILATRLANYTVHYSKENTINQKLIDRLIKYCTLDYFTNDLKYVIVRTLFTKNTTKFNKMLMNPEILKMTSKS